MPPNGRIQEITPQQIADAVAILSGMPRQVQRSTPLALTTEATPFGCCNFFDQCSDEIVGLHYTGQLPLLDWMGFNVSDECYRSIDFINYVRPEQAAGVCTEGFIGDPCDDPNGIEFGSCRLTIEDFGRYGRHGPTRDIMKPQKYCKTDPRRQYDGTPVTDEREWDMRFIADVVLDDIRRAAVNGNAATAGQMDGLQQWVATGYDCTMLDSIVIDWNGNGANGGAGATWNGTAIGANWTLIDVLLDAYRRVKRRISWSAVLNAQQMRYGDMIILIPFDAAQCLLDAYTCWSVCDGRQFNEVNLQTYEARQFRTQLLGGLFGFGQITLDGFPIPILAYDWEMILPSGNADMYLLTGSVGSNRIWEGEHLEAEKAASEMGTLGYFSSDGGRMLWKWEVDNLCRQLKGWMHPRMWCRAPFAQVRFQDIDCTRSAPPMSADPCESWFPEDSFIPAVCP